MSMKDNNGDVRGELLAIEPQMLRTIHHQQPGEGEAVWRMDALALHFPNMQRHPVYVMGPTKSWDFLRSFYSVPDPEPRDAHKTCEWR